MLFPGSRTNEMSTIIELRHDTGVKCNSAGGQALAGGMERRL